MAYLSKTSLLASFYCSKLDKFKISHRFFLEKITFEKFLMSLESVRAERVLIGYISPPIPMIIYGKCFGLKKINLLVRSLENRKTKNQKFQTSFSTLETFFGIF